MMIPRGSGIRDNILILALLIFASILEVYSDVPIGDGDPRVRPGDVDVDKSYPMKTANEEDSDNVLLWKMTNSLKNQEDIILESSTENTKKPDTSVKNTDVKKWVTLLKGSYGTAKIERQPKWKIKKGAPMFCYFKLCSFKSPVFTKSER